MVKEVKMLAQYNSYMHAQKLEIRQNKMINRPGLNMLKNLPKMLPRI